jgi:hypothetical protein
MAAVPPMLDRGVHSMQRLHLFPRSWPSAVISGCRLACRRSSSVTRWSIASPASLTASAHCAKPSDRSTCGATSAAATRTSIWPGLRDVDYRTKSFSCSACGASATLTVTDPTTETGMGDYRLDQIERPQHHPRAIDRLSGERPQMNVDQSGGELPGRNLVGRR